MRMKIFNRPEQKSKVPENKLVEILLPEQAMVRAANVWHGFFAQGTCDIDIEDHGEEKIRQMVGRAAFMADLALEEYETRWRLGRFDPKDESKAPGAPED